MKKIGSIIILSLFLVSCLKHNEAVNTSVRQQIDLTGQWKFKADPNNEGDSVGWFNSGIDKSYWPLVSVPVGFDNCGPGMERYFGTAWFSRDILIPESFRSRRITLHFEGINYNAKVWVNGKLVGENHDPFLPFDLLANDVIKTGDMNNITVSINNIRKLGQFPLFEGWYGQGGFLREASLVATDATFISGIKMTASTDSGGQAKKGHIAVITSLVNGYEGSKNLKIRINVTDKTGKKIATISSPDVLLKPGGEGFALAEGDIRGVEFWSPDSPVLYTVEVSLLSGNTIIDQQLRRTGFRNIEVRDAKIFVNDKQIYLLGFNRHEDSPRTGMAVDLQQAREDFTRMKNIGCNYVRFCHYPHHPGELDLCDELGLFVLAENAMNEWGRIDHPAPNPGIPLTPEDAPLIIENAKRTLTKMVARDNHHPSIIIWSVSNENDESRKDVAEGNAELIMFGKTLDSSRPWTHVSNSFRKEGWENFYNADDVIVVNAYPTHWYKASEEEIAAGLPMSTKIMQDTLKRLHEKFPEKPIVVGEYGFPGGDEGEKGARKQAVATEAEFKGLSAPYIAGGALWCYARHPWPWYNMSTYGYVSRDRKTEFPAFAVIRKLYRQKAEAMK